MLSKGLERFMIARRERNRRDLSGVRLERDAELDRYKAYGDLADVKEAVQAATLWNYIYHPAEYGPMLPVSRSWDFVGEQRTARCVEESVLFECQHKCSKNCSKAVRSIMLGFKMTSPRSRAPRWSVRATRNTGIRLNQVTGGHVRQGACNCDMCIASRSRAVRG